MAVSGKIKRFAMILGVFVALLLVALYFRMRSIGNTLDESRKFESLVGYYLEIADDHMGIRSDRDGRVFDQKSKLALIANQDEINGLIEIRSVEISSSYSIALVKKSPEAIVGFIEDGASVQHGPRFLTKRGKEWFDITEQVFPRITDAFILDRYRTKIPKESKLTIVDLEAAVHSPVRYAFYGNGQQILAYAGLRDDGTSKEELFNIQYDGSKFIIKKD